MVDVGQTSESEPSRRAHSRRRFNTSSSRRRKLGRPSLARQFQGLPVDGINVPAQFLQADRMGRREGTVTAGQETRSLIRADWEDTAFPDPGHHGILPGSGRRRNGSRPLPVGPESMRVRFQGISRNHFHLGASPVRSSVRPSRECSQPGCQRIAQLSNPQLPRRRAEPGSRRWTGTRYRLRKPPSGPTPYRLRWISRPLIEPVPVLP